MTRSLIYHTGDEKAVVGPRGVVKAAYPDPKQDDPKLVVVDLEAGKALEAPVTLARHQGGPAFADLALVRQARLSVVPVPAPLWTRLAQDGSVSGYRTKAESGYLPPMPRTPFQVVAPFAARRRPAQRHRRTDRGASARRQVPDAPRRHRVGQDDDAGAHARQLRQARRWSCPTTRPSPPSSTASSGSSCRPTRSSTSFPTTTTTSPRRTSRPPTCTSRRTRRSTRTSSGCGSGPPRA